MPPRQTPGAMLWDKLPWESVLRASCPKQHAQTAIEHTTRRACLSTTTRRRKPTALKREMYKWLNGPGKVFEKPLEDSTNYLGAYDENGNLKRSADGSVDGARSGKSTTPSRDRDAELKPFPLNQYFTSQSVLSEELREEVYQQVLKHDMDISSVSAAFGIDKRRVAAVVRLKTIEKRWIEEGKPLARSYNDAVLKMLPLTVWRGPHSRVKHEATNDLPVHSATRNQLFYSAPESRQFNRTDAAKAFSQSLLPADDRIPHPDMIDLARWKLEGVPDEERSKRLRAKLEKARVQKEAAQRKKEKTEADTLRVVPGKRWDFKFRNISVDSAGHDGMSPDGVGVRYGMPHDDRKRGKYKLPTSVE